MAKKTTILEKITLQGADSNSRFSEEYLIKSLFSNNLVEDILTLKEEAFFSPDLREVYKTIKQLREEGKEAEALDVLNEMERNEDVRDAFKAIGYAKSPETWGGTKEEIDRLIRDSIIKNAGLPDSGITVYDALLEVKQLYIKRLSDSAAIYLGNAEKFPAEDVISALAQVQADLTAATTGGHLSLFRNVTEEEILEEMQEDYDGLSIGYIVYDNPR